MLPREWRCARDELICIERPFACRRTCEIDRRVQRSDIAMLIVSIALEAAVAILAVLAAAGASRMSTALHSRLAHTCSTTCPAPPMECAGWILCRLFRWRPSVLIAVWGCTEITGELAAAMRLPRLLNVLAGRTCCRAANLVSRACLDTVLCDRAAIERRAKEDRCRSLPGSSRW